ncbi:MAG: LuxR C-terminal-related transcriptional regulator [Tannerella sp.]|jgi:DNA-binding CsgD family transcriptional regulator|nr:LuxR C-terminal-related transcriptional regulator [Tannerella sp.]
MVRTDDFFMSSNAVLNIPEEEYKRVDLLIDTFDAISRTTYQSLYIIDYYKKNFLYVSGNPLFLCGNTAQEVRRLGYMFYIKHVPEREQEMLIEINRAGFDFHNKIPVTERAKYTISYNFHLLNGKKKILINHKLTPVQLTGDGKVWLAACVVSLSSRDAVGCVEMRKIDETAFWSYSFENKRWKEEAGVVLNERERDILLLSAQGYSMNEIADKICLSIDTIKFYRRKLFEKLNAKNITEATAFAANHKLL